MRSVLVAKHLRTTGDYEAAKLNVWLRPQSDQAQQGLDSWWWPKADITSSDASAMSASEAKADIA